MMFDPPVHFASPKYENASAMVLFCKEVLEKSGRVEDARKLEGIDPVNCASIARIAHGVLQDISMARLPLSGDAKEYVQIAKDLLEEALGAQRETLRSAS